MSYESKVVHYKKCSHCHEILPLDNFHKVASNPDGLHYVCKSCTKKLSVVSRARRLQERPFHQMWKRMMEVCHLIPNYTNVGEQLQKTWDNYGGRGIVVSEEFHDYETFEAYITPIHEKASIAYGPNVDLMIDRIDVNGNYERGNLRFVSPIESAMNRRMSQVEEYEHVGPNGPMTLPITWWARIYQQEPGSVMARLRRGWHIARALNEPPELKYTSNENKPQTEITDIIEQVEGKWLMNDELISFTALCAHFKVNQSTVKFRLKKGWSIERAFGTRPE